MSPVDLLGWTGSILVVVSLTQSNLGRLRLVNLAASILHLTFNLIIGIVPMIALNLVLTGINSYFLLTAHLKAKRDIGPAAAGATMDRPRPLRMMGRHAATVANLALRMDRSTNVDRPPLVDAVWGPRLSLMTATPYAALRADLSWR